MLSQTKSSKQKIYSLHWPEVQRISKRKEHKKYEFGNKVSIICSVRGVILGAASFCNQYDGHTIDIALEQVSCWQEIEVIEVSVNRVKPKS